MKRKVQICLVAVFLLVGGFVMYVSAGDPVRCISECAAEKGDCMNRCQGDGCCVSDCASDYAQCVSRCY